MPHCPAFWNEQKSKVGPRLKMGGSTPLSSDACGNRSDGLFVAICVAMSVASVFVLLRLYTRRVILRKFRIDDWSLVAAWILVLSLNLCLATSTRIGGLGRHYNDLNKETHVSFSKTMWASTWLYQLAVTALKTTFCLQYLRVFLIGYVRPCTWALLIFSLLWGLSAALVCVFFCVPVESIWNYAISGTCIKNMAFWPINGAVHVITDIIIFVIPLPILCKLTAPKIQKVSLAAVFVIGLLTCIFSVIRIVVLERKILEPDRTWAYVDISMWSTVELACATICACVPTLRPLAAKLSVGTKSVLSRVSWVPRTKHGIFTTTELDGTVESGGTFCTTDIESRYELALA